jgi:sulfopyruvate decarboxylase subunit beta
VSIAETILDILKQEQLKLFTVHPCAKIRRLYDLVLENFQGVPLAKEEEGVGINAGSSLAMVRAGMLIQSTGLGNMINAICSLILTYQLPLFVLASWRGVYKEKIPAQIPLGTRLPRILQAAGCNSHQISQPNDIPQIQEIISRAFKENKAEIVLLHPKLWEDDSDEVFLSFDQQNACKPNPPRDFSEAIKPEMVRYDVIKALLPFLREKLVVCNIGWPSRELYNLLPQPSNFYMLGSLGLASSIGLGIALNTSQEVLVIDGDGSLLSNMGTLATIAQTAPPNLTIIAIDNAVHGSTGNQATATQICTDLSQTASGLGIKQVYKTAKSAELLEYLNTRSQGPYFIHVLARPGNAQVPPLPLTPLEIKQNFIEQITK